MRPLLILLALAAATFAAPLTGNKITEDGTYTVTTIPGARYVFAVSGDFGSGSLAINWNDGTTSTAYANSPATAAESWTFTAPAKTFELVLTDSTDPDLTVTVSPADGEGATVDNTSVNSAIAAAPSATRSALRTDGFIDVRDYGAAGDGVEDDTAEIQAALDAMADDATISEVRLPAGNFRITSALILKIPGSLIGLRKIALVGAGPYVTQITQHTSNSDGIQVQIQSTGTPGTDYCEFVTISGFQLRTASGIGHANSTGRGIDIHDDRLSAGHFNGGSLIIEDIIFGSAGFGWDTALYFEKWDTSLVRRCRFLYNYQQIYISRMTKTVSFENCGISQAESINVNVAESGKVLFKNCDMGNAPQFYRLGAGAHVTVDACNHESVRFSPTMSPRRYNVATTTYPMYAPINNTTGWAVGAELITTTSNHGFKPGNYVNFHFGTAMPTVPNDAQQGTELYQVMADGFSATTFKVLPIFRTGTSTNGGDTLTLTETRTNNYDLEVDDKVLLRPDVGITNVTAGEYWITQLVGTTGIKVSATQGGTPITYTHDTNLGSTAIQIFPQSPLKRTNVAATSQVIGVSCPAIAIQHGAVFTTRDSQYTGGADVPTAPLAAVGTGSWFNSVGAWHSTGWETASSTFGGRVCIISLNCTVRGSDIPVTNKVAQDEFSMRFAPAHWNYMADNGLPTSPDIRNRGEFFMPLRRAQLGVPDKVFMLTEDGNGNLVHAPVLNSQLRDTTQIAAGTEASRYQLKPNTRYRVDFSAAAAQIVLEMPNDTNQPTGSLVDEELAVDDEITIHVVNVGSAPEDRDGDPSFIYPVRIRLTGTNNSIRYLGSVSSNGTSGGIQLFTGDTITLKCTSVVDHGSWQVVQSLGTPVTF